MSVPSYSLPCGALTSHCRSPSRHHAAPLTSRAVTRLINPASPRCPPLFLSLARALYPPPLSSPTLNSDDNHLCRTLAPTTAPNGSAPTPSHFHVRTSSLESHLAPPISTPPPPPRFSEQGHNGHSPPICHLRKVARPVLPTPNSSSVLCTSLTPPFSPLVASSAAPHATICRAEQVIMDSCHETSSTSPSLTLSCSRS
jgi:hypothetical protein